MIKGHRFRSPKRPVFVGPLVNHNLKHFARTKQSTSRLNCCSTRLIPGLSYVGCKSDCPLQRHIYSGMDHSHSFRAQVPLSLNIFNDSTVPAQGCHIQCFIILFRCSCYLIVRTFHLQISKFILGPRSLGGFG